MFRSLAKVATPLTNINIFLNVDNVLKQQLRTTYILKRRFRPLLHKKGYPIKTLRNREYIYDVVENTDFVKKPNIDVILTSFVDGVGNVGEKVSVPPSFAYNKLLLPGLALYATPENEEKYKDHQVASDVEHYSSRTALKVIQNLSRFRLAVVMNKDEPWVLKPWHIKASFRKAGYVMPEDAITLPAETIKGPDMSIDGKQFYVTVKINNKEDVNVLCQIRHWATIITERLPYVEKFYLRPSDPIFPEHAEIISKIPAKLTQTLKEEVEEQ